MDHKYTLLSLLIILFLPCRVAAQANQAEPAKETMKTVYVEKTFPSTRVILGQSVQTPDNGNLVLIISHHFGAINTGFYNLFGLDQATTRIGVEYGFNDFLAAGFGRSTYNKTWDGFVKARLLTQSKGARNMPVSLSIFGNIIINTLKDTHPGYDDVFSGRLSYCTELIFARKFGDLLAFQIEPVWIHKNLVQSKDDHNDQFAVGGGGSVRLSKRISINAEYFYFFPGQTVDPVYNSLSVGCDISVGGHIFQLFLTNSQGNFEEAFISENNGKWTDGDIYIGFNIHRDFDIKFPKHSKFR